MFDRFWFGLCLWRLIGVFADSDAVKSVSVMEGDSVSLQTNTELQTAGAQQSHQQPDHTSGHQQALSHMFRIVHCCGSTEAVIRLVVTALVGVAAAAAVVVLVYDIRSRRAELDRPI